MVCEVRSRSSRSVQRFNVYRLSLCLHHRDTGNISMIIFQASSSVPVISKISHASFSFSHQSAPGSGPSWSIIEVLDCIEPTCLSPM